jgi:hypothetical protein
LYLELLQGHSFEQFPAALEVFGRRTDHGASLERSRPEEKRDYGWRISVFANEVDSQSAAF